MSSLVPAMCFLPPRVPSCGPSSSPNNPVKHSMPLRCRSNIKTGPKRLICFSKWRGESPGQRQSLRIGSKGRNIRECVCSALERGTLSSPLRVPRWRLDRCGFLAQCTSGYLSLCTLVCAGVKQRVCDCARVPVCAQRLSNLGEGSVSPSRCVFAPPRNGNAQLFSMAVWVPPSNQICCELIFTLVSSSKKVQCAV